MHFGDFFNSLALLTEGIYITRAKGITPIEVLIYICFTCGSFCWFLWGVFMPNQFQIWVGALFLTIQGSVLIYLFKSRQFNWGNLRFRNLFVRGAIDK